MILSERLRHIVDMLPNSDCIADIGTDHGYILVHCINKGLCKRGIATDINKGPLEIAIKNFKKYRVLDKIQTRIGDGLEPLQKGEADTILIAGMGGNLIVKILEGGKEIVRSTNILVLQPMQYPEILRKYLNENDFRIIDEDIVKEDEKFYHILKVSNGSEPPYEKEVFYYTGKILIQKKHPVLREFINYKIKNLEEILRSVPKDNKRYNELNQLLLEFKEVGEWM